MLARPLWILAVCALIVTLRLGRGALIPVALAVLIALVPSGVVEALRRYHIPRGSVPDGWRELSGPGSRGRSYRGADLPRPTLWGMPGVVFALPVTRPVIGRRP